MNEKKINLKNKIKKVIKIKKKELGIYIHIPICKQKCYYCDFVSYTNKEKYIGEYIESVKKEIESYELNEYKITTIYIGGGTPSAIESKYIVQILKTINKKYDVDKQCEITIEVNPGTVTKEKLEEYKKAGINRLSIGLQTTNNKLLKQIGRIHTFEEFLNTYNMAQEMEFENINMDLIIGIPNQTMEDIEKQLAIVLKLKPQHISIYSLIVEEDTPLAQMIDNGKYELPLEEVERDMYWKTKKVLEQNGYIHYEISNFAQKGFESKHNMNCWKQKEYIGVGVAAHSYLNKVRYSNIEKMENYIKNIEDKKINLNKIIHENQTIENQKKEYMLLGLRKLDGINITEFKQKFNENPIYIFRKEISKLVKEDLLVVDENTVKLTDKGIDLANLVWEEFV